MAAKRTRPRWLEGLVAGPVFDLITSRFTALTILLLVLAFSASIIPPGDTHDVTIDIAYTILFFFAVRAVGPRARLVTLLLAIPTAAGHWSLHLANPPVSRVAIVAFSTGYMAYLSVVMLSIVLREAVITTDTLMGAICVYFLFGVTWGGAYTLIDLRTPGAFHIDPDLARAAGMASSSSPATPLFMYYSFATLSTLGYGDMSPLAPAARSLSVLEGLAGPLYLAILIAHLVSMRAARPR
jgi:hypothetical protein